MKWTKRSLSCPVLVAVCMALCYITFLSTGRCEEDRQSVSEVQTWDDAAYRSQLACDSPEVQLVNVSDWHGYTCYELTFEGRQALIAVPREAAVGRPWVWRARFWGHEPQTDLAMLARGWHVAYVDSAPLLGSPESVALWQKFYLFVTQHLALAPKACLEGMSRGGLYISNWAVAYPDQIAAIYLDNPVLDFRVWPGGGGKSQAGRSESDWQAILTYYHLTEEQAMAYDKCPVDTCDILVAAKIPMILICGDSDRVVPYSDNGQKLYEKYQAAGAPIKLILKPGADHHPHSLPDATPIVEFFLAAFGN
ncbi:MAG: prolyl oligopeptidase family serine peptidase [Planctomycetia bacterium]|nr:prolyl oligopeptidase family serine peptidase [Planctomycetia bacterium]